MKEWKSKKELEQFILTENRNEFIGLVKTKTLRKWKVLTDPKDYDWLENMYILQEGNRYFYTMRMNTQKEKNLISYE